MMITEIVDLENLRIIFETAVKQLESGFPVLSELTTGGWLFYGGLAGIMLSIIAILLSFAIFPVKRRRLLKKLGE